MLKRIAAAVSAAGVIAVASSCGTFFPDRIFYPTDMPDTRKEVKKEQKDAAVHPAPAVESPKPAEEASSSSQPESEDKGALIFGAGPSQPTAKKPASESISKKSPGQDMNIPEPPAAAQGDKKSAAPPLAVDAVRSDFAPNALVRTFNLGYDAAWQKTVEVLLSYPLISTDKTGGVIITDWIMEKGIEGDYGAGIFGSGARVIRYKYMVRLSGKDDATEILVAPHAQYSQERRWVDATPKIIVTEELMRRIILKLEK